MSVLRPGVARAMIDHLQMSTTLMQVEGLTMTLEGVFDTIEKETATLNAIERIADSIENNVSLEDHQVAMLKRVGRPSTSMSLEGLRDQVKVVWKNIIKHII